MNIYEFNCKNEDSVVVDIAINLNLYEKNSRISNINPPKRSLIEVGFCSKEPFSSHIKQHYAYHQDDFNKYERLQNAYKVVSQLNSEGTLDINIDSLNHFIGVDIKTEGILPYLLLLGQNNNINKKADGYKSFFIVSDSLYCDIHNHFFKPRYETKASFIYGFNDFAPRDGVEYQNSVFSNPFTFFALENISQQYIKIIINTQNPLNKYGSSPLEVRTVNINTVGASDIQYNVIPKFGAKEIKSNTRLDGIDIKGNAEEIILYIDSKEGAALQSLRMFFLTTLLTVVITLLFGTSFSILKTAIRKN